MVAGDRFGARVVVSGNFLALSAAAHALTASYRVPAARRRPPPQVSMLIAGSEAFRRSLLSIAVDPMYCALINTHLADLVSAKQLKAVSRAAREVREEVPGAVVYSSR